MIDCAYLPPVLLAMRCACHLLIALRIFAYKPNNQRPHRSFVGLVAGMFGGLNLMECIHIYANFNSISTSFEPYLSGIILFVLMFIVWTGGNIAKFIPKKLIQRLP
jgi:hypothetical protein